MEGIHRLVFGEQREGWEKVIRIDIQFFDWKDWSVKMAKINKGVQCSTLTERDLFGPKIISLGKNIYNKAISLSHRINSELLYPISKWIDDEDFIQRHRVIEKKVTNWKYYKRKQREANLRAAWEALRRKRDKQIKFSKYQSYVANLIPRGGNKGSSTRSSNDTSSMNFLSLILTPYSLVGKNDARAKKEFMYASRLEVTDKYPWPLLIGQSLHSPSSLVKLPVYYQKSLKRDLTAKFLQLLYMETEGEVELQQKGHLSNIEIVPVNIDYNQKIVLKDQTGTSYTYNWHFLNNGQKNKILSDIESNKVLCKVV